MAFRHLRIKLGKGRGKTVTSVSEIKQLYRDISGRATLNRNIQIQRDNSNKDINNKTKSRDQHNSVTEILEIDKLMEKSEKWTH